MDDGYALLAYIKHVLEANVGEMIDTTKSVNYHLWNGYCESLSLPEELPKDIQDEKD